MYVIVQGILHAPDLVEHTVGPTVLCRVAKTTGFLTLTGWGLIWSNGTRNHSYIYFMGKVVSTKGNLGNMMLDTIASGGNRVALY